MKKYIAPLILSAAFLVGPVFAKSVTTASNTTHKEAKKKCLEENPNLKGKELKSCIKTKKAS